MGHHPDRACAVRRRPRRGRVAAFRPKLGVASARVTASAMRSRSRGPRRAGCVASNRLLPQCATRLQAFPRLRRILATPGSGADAHVRSARRQEAGRHRCHRRQESRSSPRRVPRRRSAPPWTSPSGSRNGRPRSDWVDRCWLCCAASLGQHIQGLMIAASTVEQRREFLDSAVLEKAKGVGARGMVLFLLGLVSIVAKPVLTVLERIGGQVEFSRVRLPEERRSRADGPRHRRRQRLRRSVGGRRCFGAGMRSPAVRWPGQAMPQGLPR